MEKCELLSPAGNMDMLKYAVNYGADAVYIAGTKFGARKYAQNFSSEELVEAINYSHLYGVKVYITINTLIYEEEIEEFLEYVEFIYKNGVDAVLVQDLGMLSLLNKKFPNLVLHASTQMHNNGQNILGLLKSMNVKRVVLDREFTLEEIASLKKEVEIETFCHGALCVSYSGQCLLSSMILNRSGNRGECAGLCRLPYKLAIENKISNEKYYLSLKDLCAIKLIPKLISLGVGCLKIEGRMKSPEYVGYMTKVYREAIDNYYTNTPFTGLENIYKNMKLLFNRGFTEGFLTSKNSLEVVNIETSNHIGIKLGTYSIQGKKIKLILMEDSLMQGDRIRFMDDKLGMTVNFIYNQNGKLIHCAQKGEVVFLDNFLGLKNSGYARKVGSIVLDKEIIEMPERKVSLTGHMIIKKGKPIKFTVSDGINSTSIEKYEPSEAENRPINKEEIEKLLRKTGNTPFEFKSIFIEMDKNIFVPLKIFNLIRREILEKIKIKRLAVTNRIVKEDINIPKAENTKSSISINVKICTLEQYNSIKNISNKIIVSNRDLYEKIKSDEKVFFMFGENSLKLDKTHYAISDLGSTVHIKDGDVVLNDYLLNVTNSYTVMKLEGFGLTSVLLSLELSHNQVEKISENLDANRLEIFIYGTPKLTKMKYTVTDSNFDNINLIDRNNKKYPIVKEDKFTYLYHYKVLDRRADLLKYNKIGINNFRIELLHESGIEAEKIVKSILYELS